MMFRARGLKCGVLGTRSKFRGVTAIASRASSQANAIPASPPPNWPRACRRERSRESHVVMPFVLTSVDIKEFVRTEERMANRGPNFLLIVPCCFLCGTEFREYIYFVLLRRPAISQKESALQSRIETASSLVQHIPGELFGAIQHERTVHQSQRLLRNDRVFPFGPISVHRRHVEHA